MSMRRLGELKDCDSVTLRAVRDRRHVDAPPPDGHDRRARQLTGDIMSDAAGLPSGAPTESRFRSPGNAVLH